MRVCYMRDSNYDVFFLFFVHRDQCHIKFTLRVLSRLWQIIKFITRNQGIEIFLFFSPHDVFSF
jgi:hypothetical protein